MIRVYVFCEGQTEETFVREVLRSHFEGLNIFVEPIILGNGSQKGGISTYGKVKPQIERKCKEDRNSWITTMIDFYRLPTDFPTSVIPRGLSSIEKAKITQQSFQEDIAQPNFIANLMVHEFESLLFSEPEAFKNWCDDPKVILNLRKICADFESPEYINDGYETAPSRRILKLWKQYDKVWHGSLISLDIGLDKIRRECPIFNSWIESLESLA
jgi:hypothetical protein